MSKFVSLKAALKRFHNDERGLEALQVVMILAVAAIVMMLVQKNYGQIKEWVEGLLDRITGWDDIETTSV